MRLFELSADGGAFLLYQAPVHELAIYDHKAWTRQAIETLLHENGPFIPNGAVDLYQDGRLGKRVFEGGDGNAERRYLETLELVTRQYNRYTKAFWTRFQPRLLVDYFPLPDEIDHTWLGFVRGSGAVRDRSRAAIDGARRAGYRLVNERLALLHSLLGPADSIVVTSDHGMAPVSNAVKVNLALSRAGFLDGTAAGPDPSKSGAIAMRSAILLNTADWKQGQIASADRNHALNEVRRALEAVTGADRSSVFAGFCTPETDRWRFGIGGPAGADLYYDLAPGYGESDRMDGPLVETLPHPIGAHGFQPDRSDMLAILIAMGPEVPVRGRWPRMRSVDVAPLVARLIGISPPARAIGYSPLALPVHK